MTLQDRELSMKNCMRCSFCKWVPSMNTEEFGHICPSIRYGKFHSYSGGGKVITAFGLMHDVVEYDDKMLDTVYACSACGGCGTGCSANLSDLVEPMETIYELRARIFKDGKLPAALSALLDNLKSTGNPQGSTQDRGVWATGLSAEPSTGDMILVVGEAAFEQSQWPQLTSLVGLLDAAKADYAILGANEVDCGGLAYELGDVAQAKALATDLVGRIKASGARRVLTQSDAVFMALRNYAPRLGVDLAGIEVIHASEWMAENAKPKAKSTETVTYHDTCKLGRLSEPYVPWNGEHETVMGSIWVREQRDVKHRFGNDGVYDAPRKVVEATGAKIVEMPRLRETSYCCGLNAGAKDFNPDFAASAAKDRLTEALSTGAKTMVTSCADCACHLQDVADKEGMDIKVSSLLEFTQAPGE
ncbi:(Fe-S)-binding protein [Phaeobacter sp. C3_T13_0]|uniref:(Fe-S)-binding protein n=1 Tax=Phaeobacter cretensis TaxID=3342641 RepID=UPI0039BCA664